MTCEWFRTSMPDETQKQSTSSFAAENRSHETPLESPRRAFVTLYDGLAYFLIMPSSVPTRITNPSFISRASTQDTGEGTVITSDVTSRASDTAVIFPNMWSRSKSDSSSYSPEWNRGDQIKEVLYLPISNHFIASLEESHSHQASQWLLFLSSHQDLWRG